MKMQVLQSKKELCICCMEEHDVKLVRMQDNMIFKDLKVDYVAEYFYCDQAGELYMEESQMSENDLRMKDAYRRALGLMTSQEITELRAKYDISQSDLCALLGWGGKTITRYEGHQVQDRAHDSILQKLRQDPEWFLKLLTDARGTVSEDAFQRYYERALHLYEESRDEYLRKSIVAEYARYGKDAYNGGVSLCLDKVVDVIRYFSDSKEATNLYKVKLMKLLWYADCLAYKLYGKAITGLVYRALPMGAVPIAHDSIIDLKGVCYEEVDMGEGTAYHFLPSATEGYPFLQEEEKAVLDKVIVRLGRMSKDEIVTYMHREKAFIETKQGEIIPFCYADDLQL